MNTKQVGRWLLMGVAAIAFVRVSDGAERLWTDSSGEFSVMAEFAGVNRGNVVLRKENGEEVTVPLRRLSARDRDFIRTQRGSGASGDKANGPAQVAEKFCNELRNEKRDTLNEMLTPKAQEVVKAAKDKSPLAALPKPEEGNRAIRVGRPALDGSVAEVPVQVRAGGMMHKAKVHLRKEKGSDDWLVFALSAEYPDGERSLNFEAPPAKEGGSPLEALVGQPFPLTGLTMGGEKLDIGQYQGKAVLVDFWATWCGPCRAEMPNVAANYQKFRDKGFEVIAVSVDEDMEALASFVTQEKPPWPVMVDKMAGPRNSMAARYGISAIPAFVLVGPDGKVVAVNCRGEALGKELDKLFAATASSSVETRYGNRQQ